MIESININGFRCFQKSKISGFKTVNLIGGQNNCGKTALLEALYLNFSPGTNTIIHLRRFRRESHEFAKNMPERSWNNLFYNTNSNKPINIKSCTINDQIFNDIELICDESTDQFKKIIEEENQKDDDLVDLRDLLTQSEFKRSTLNIYYVKDGKKQPIASLISHSKGIISKDLIFPDNKKVNYMPSSFRLSSDALAREHDKADLNDKTQHLLSAIKIIDNTITEIRTFNIGEPSVYLKKKDGVYLPIYLYGEAVSKITELILRILNDAESVLLIDEIENGIHHTHQIDLWKYIFKLAIDFNVQIFATTHSYEMIKSFTDAGLSSDNYRDNASYFEITKNIKSGEIIGIERDLEGLRYEIDRKMGFRGE